MLVWWFNVCWPVGRSVGVEPLQVVALKVLSGFCQFILLGVIKVGWSTLCFFVTGCIPYCWLSNTCINYYISMRVCQFYGFIHFCSPLTIDTYSVMFSCFYLFVHNFFAFVVACWTTCLSITNLDINWLNSDELRVLASKRVYVPSLNGIGGLPRWEAHSPPSHWKLSWRHPSYLRDWWRHQTTAP